MDYHNSALHDLQGSPMIMPEPGNNEILYRQILENLPVAVYTCDAEGYILMYNKTAEALWGRRPVIGKEKWCGSWKIFYPDGTPMPHDECPMAKVLNGKLAKNTQEILVECEDGTQRNVLPNPQPILNASGKLCGAMNMLVDITEEKKTKEKIKDSESKLNIAIDAAQLGTWELNLQTKAVYYSKRYLEILGYNTPVTLNHVQLLEHIHPEDLNLRNEKTQEGLKKGFINYEMRVIWNDKSIHWIKVQGKAFYDDEGNPEKMLGTIIDITDRKNTEEELERRVFERTAELHQANLKLERSNHELEQYAYVASHDLQEPLRKIRTYSGMLYHELVQKYDKSTAAVLQKVINSAERMSNLIYDLLNFSRLLKPENVLEKTDLNTIIRNIISDFELALEQKKARIEIDALPVINSVPLQMNQLFYNLLNNALKFSRKDTPPVILVKAIPLSTEQVAMNKNLNPQLTYIDITVSDNGIGFNSVNAEQIFEVFKRLHTKDSYPGSGIGLALCRKIIVNHEGDIMPKVSKTRDRHSTPFYQSICELTNLCRNLKP